MLTEPIPDHVEELPKGNSLRRDKRPSKHIKNQSQTSGELCRRREVGGVEGRVGGGGGGGGGANVGILRTRTYLNELLSDIHTQKVAVLMSFKGSVVQFVCLDIYICCHGIPLCVIVPCINRWDRLNVRVLFSSLLC